MYYVYILQSKKNRSYYIGSSKRPDKRLVEHNSGKTKSLKYIRPLTLVFRQAYETASQAKKIEARLKQFKSKKIVEQIIKEGIIKIKP